MDIRNYLISVLAVIQTLLISNGLCEETTSPDSSTAPLITSNVSRLESKLIHTKSAISESIEGRILWEDENIKEPYISRPIDVATFDDLMYEHPNPDSCTSQNDKDIIRQLGTLLIYYNVSENRNPDIYIRDYKIDVLIQSSALNSLMELLANQRLHMKTLVDELISYHNKVTSINSWKKIFQESENIRYDNGTWFHDKGFPDNENACRKLRYPAWGNGREVVVDPEGWLYSFWLRRYKAGTDEISINILRLLSRTLDG